MVADVRPGRAFIATVPFYDSNGSPVTGATTGTKVMTITGPTGATVTSGGVTHQGGGRWGITVAGSFHTTPGTYKATLDQIISGSDTMTGAVMTYEVGYDNAWTLRELYQQIRVDLGDGFPGTTTGNGSTTTLVDARRAYGSNNDWVSSELFLFEPGAVADLNPVTVTAFAASSGTFTFTGQAITSTVAGQDYILGNKDGAGWRHEQIMAALTLAVRRVGGGAMLTDEDSLTYSTTTAEYSVPATFASVTALAYQPTGSPTGRWLPLAARYWDWQPDRRRVVLTRVASGRYGVFLPHPYGQGFDIPAGSRLRLTGRAVPQLPALFAGAIDANGQQVYDAAMLALLGGSSEPSDRQRAVMMAGLTGRPRVRMPG